MAVPEWLWFIFIFAFGSCVGSFLNVVIYRLPRDKSLVKPPSSCPACGRHIQFYDNIPLISWLVLGRKCRHCKAAISPRYFVIELLTGVVFVGLFILYFRSDVRSSIGQFRQGGWFVYLLHIILLGSLIAASAIDLELWVIPISICWFATAAGVIGSCAGAYVIEVAKIKQYLLVPSTSDIILREITVASLAAGALVGLVISLLLLATGFMKRSYESEEPQGSGEQSEGTSAAQMNHRLEVCKEIVFLLPIVVCSFAAYLISRNSAAVQSLDFSQHPAVGGLLGSIWGYFVGCGVIWATRIFGTLVFGKEAMGLGDVHLMGAAGAFIGAPFVIAAFFIAPFFGL
ncbi:MAG: prepilin peptidase, partial [Planctomycetota bacterium]